jgi:hypothetical protein
MRRAAARKRGVRKVDGGLRLTDFSSGALPAAKHSRHENPVNSLFLDATIGVWASRMLPEPPRSNRPRPTGIKDAGTTEPIWNQAAMSCSTLYPLTWHALRA